MTVNISGKLLNEHEAAELLGIKVSTLRAWRIRGSKLPFLRLGRAIRYDPEDLSAFREASKAYSTTEADHA